MTTINGITSGSPLIGSPIIVEVIAAEVAAVDTLAYHRVVVQVVAALEGVDLDYTTQQFYATIGDESAAGRTKQFDISSALQTVADKYEYTCNAATYPRIKFRIVAWEELMVNGVPSSGAETEYPGRSGQNPLYLFALQGAYSKADRRASNGYKKVMAFSRKPTSSPQVVVVGETFAYTPAFDGTEVTPAKVDFSGYAFDDLPCGPTSEVVTIATEGLQTIGGVPVFAMSADYASPHRREFRFINSLGVLESISVYSLAEVSGQLEYTAFNKAMYDSFESFVRAFYRKHDGAEKIKLSSGALDRHWQQWFLHEFCMSRDVWMFVPDEKANVLGNIGTTVSSESNGEWLPVHITTEESVVLTKEDGTDIMEVAFVVEFDDEGSTDSYLRV